MDVVCDTAAAPADAGILADPIRADRQRPGPAPGPKLSSTEPAARFVQIDQFVPSLALHDAIGNHVLQLRRLLQGAGYGSEIFYEHVDPRLAGEARPFRESPAGPDPSRLIVYHASTHSEMTEWLIDAADGGQPVVMDYHNITPAGYFARWEPVAARSMELARAQLASLAPRVDAAVSDSAYNAAELIELGQPASSVCPLLLDLDEFLRPPDQLTVDRLRRAGGPRWLFVGRVAPNKCQHDVIAAFAVYRRLYQPGARLSLVGGATSGRYQRSLTAMVADLGLGDHVDFVGSAPFPDLLAHFRAADVFVCLSEHEGFCVPVIEAMHLGVPVVAHRAAAVTETVADAGVLLDGKDPLEVANAVDRLLADESRRAALVAAGRARAAAFGLEPASAAWLAALQRVAVEVGGRPASPGGSGPGRSI